MDEFEDKMDAEDTVLPAGVLDEEDDEALEDDDMLEGEEIEEEESEEEGDM